MSWSRTSRLFPCEQKLGGYLPVLQHAEAVMKTGYQGWWSLEVFNSTLEDTDEECPRRHGIRGLKGLRKLWEEVQQCLGDPRSRL
jgi:4-hydroxyphenylpyruvate dioxygenase